MKICFLTKIEKLGVEDAINFTKKRIPNIDVYDGSISSPFPSEIIEKQYDILISYISTWIVPKAVLAKTKRWNINFHPGSPEYPGIGCFNFAIFESAKQFGATAHIMEPKVDRGEIIGVKRFSMVEEETVESLSLKTYSALSSLYKDIISYVVANDSLPHSDETWKRKPYKRSELEELARINTDMSEDEINKKIRATYYPGKPAPYIEVHGHKFEYNPDR